MPHSVSLQDSSADRKDDELMSDAPPTETASANQEDNAAAGVKLEDLFNDDDDDEYPTSSSPETQNGASSAPAPAAAPGSQVDTDTMLAFYQRLFPFRYLFQWLNHGIVPSPDFGNREFALTLQNDAYLRYQSYATADLFRKDILKMNPSRFEIGPVYNTNPRDRKTLRGGQMKPVAKELVFDIDLTDYDDIRSCCEKANICSKCWAFVTMAMKVVDTALREDFGFEHILWVYSGRRGAHAWVCDPRARSLPDDRRRAIAGYLDVIRGGNSSGKRVNLKRPLHPHMSRSLEILKPYFAQTTLVDQETFSSTEQTQRILSLLPDKGLNESLRKRWESSPDRSSANKWADIDALAKTGKSSTLNPTTLRDAKQDIVLEYTYPRLDSEVSKKMIHLLKSPFVIHPGTGRVCVPIDARKAEQFDPLAVPTVTELLAEIDAWDAEHPSNNAGPEVAEGEGSVPESDARGSRRLQDYEKTSLKPYVDYFRSFIAGLLKEERTGKRERADDATEVKTESMEF
ncbi:DNA primase subunit Pri1 [Aspergillus eucalypticola CBS 122712]|uniref:DNA primase n=1 Tax=Aspergillus eucalypticola (strain CBS 122712 / IBT 29274) TaxID=1448314 RepID=A0A317VIX2_ASPEC|nr:DNA primase subunit Pri1 [Aspergillus eucalypticola CBS 122712]PWY72782.1 DNA primase subunit Pri1 [Aspergillus eucalypticola CBS 122712]